MTAAQRIVLLSQHFPPFVGGSAVLFGELYGRLRDHRVTVLTDRNRDRLPPTEGGLEIVETSVGNDKWGVLGRGALGHHLRVSGALRRAIGGRPSTVHCGRILPEGVAALLNRWSRGVPYLCWVHGEDLMMQMHSSREYRLLTRLICRYAAGFLANSNNTAQLVRDTGVRADRVAVVYPGVDPVRFHPSNDGDEVRRRFGASGPLLLSVGRLQRRKGFDLTLQAVARLRQRHRELRYVLVGDGQDREYLETMIRELDLQDSAFLAGRVADADLPGYYAACDVFVHPNRREGVDIEGFGIVFLEAAASGRPAIGGRSGGVSEAVEDRVSGVLVSGEDVDELAAAIDRLLVDGEYRREMGEAGRHRVVESFTWERSAEVLSRTLEGLGRES